MLRYLIENGWLPGFHFEGDEGAAGGPPSEGAEGANNSGLEAVQAQLDGIRETNAQVANVLERVVNASAAAGPAEEEEGPAAPQVDLAGLPDPYSDLEGFQRELGQRVTEGMGLTQEQAASIIRSEMKTLRDEVMSQAEDRMTAREVHSLNINAAKDYFTENSVPAAAQKEIINFMRSMPHVAKFGDKHEGSDFFVFNRQAFRAADMAIRGNDIVAAAEARGKEEGRRAAADSSNFGELFGEGGEGAGFNELSPLDQIERLEQMPVAQRDAMLYEMEESDLVGLVKAGQAEFEQQGRQGFRPPRR